MLAPHGPGSLEWHRAQVSANTSLPRATEFGSELAIELRDELGLRCEAACPVQVGRTAGEQEVGDVLQPVLDGAEVRAVAPALADVEWRLTEPPVLGIGLPQVGDVIDPALFGAGADVEVHALDGFERADTVFAAFEDVVDPLGLLRPLPALPVLARLAPARPLVRIRLRTT